MTNSTQSSTIDYILGSDSITVILDGTPFTINSQAHTFDLVLEAVKRNNIDQLRNAINIKLGIATELNKNGSVRIEGNNIFYQDREVTGLVASRIFEIIRLGLDVRPMTLFLENLMLNPSKRAVDELFGFLEACSLPITSDGCFLAYKRIRENYTDCHSGTMDNSVGNVVEMPRNAVDEDKERTCSYGLHACSYDYLKHFSGAKVVVVKINPKDVVSVPADYNNAKLRCCKYEVVDELPLSDDMLPSKKIQDGYSDSYDEDWYDVDAEEELEETDDHLDAMTYVYTCSFQKVTVPANTVPANTNGKLTADEVRYIRSWFYPGSKESVTELARMFNVSPRTIARIRDGESYKDVV